MIKKLFKDKPDVNSRGHYVFFNNDAISYSDSNGVSTNLFDKFDKRELYTTIQEDIINRTIIENTLVPVARSSIEFQGLKIVNSGVKHDVKSVLVYAAFFDKNIYIKQLDNLVWLRNNFPSDKPGYNKLVNAIQLITTDFEESVEDLEFMISKFFGISYDFITDKLFDQDNTEPKAAGYKTLLHTIFPTAGLGSWLIVHLNAYLELNGREPLRDLRIYKRSKKNVKEGKDFGTILKKVTVMENLQAEFPNNIDFGIHSIDAFDAYNNFDISEEGLQGPGYAGGWDESTGELILDGSPIMFDKYGFQDLYVAVYMRGNARRWWGTDRRRKRIQVFKFNSRELFTDDVIPQGKVTELSFTYGNSRKASGGGGKGGPEAPAFKCKSLKIKIDTTMGFQNNPGLNYSPFATEISSSVVAAQEFKDETLQSDFLLQSNYQTIHNFDSFNGVGSTYGGDVDLELKSNFEPLAKINPRGFNYDLQAYQSSSIERQICSAPGEVSLDFEICNYAESSHDLIPRDYSSNTEVSDTFSNPNLYMIPDLLQSGRLVTEYEYTQGFNFTIGNPDETARQYCIQLGYDLGYSDYTVSANYSTLVGSHSPWFWDTTLPTRAWNLHAPLSMFDYKHIESITCARSTFQDVRGYKFYVISWDDINNKFKTPDDYFGDIPEDLGKMIIKQDQDLYKFSEVGTPLIHGYSTSGIKTIKGVLFSYTKTGKKQIVRWKFFKSKIFLDLPLTKYPDFFELGGSDYTTIPWPYTTLVIGGISTNSNYKNSIRNTLGSGKISEDELVTERILIEADANDELGQSILEFDLEQVRYFNEPYSIADLLDIPIQNAGEFTPHNSDYWDCNDWNGERNYCFPDESSVGQIFIGDNVDPGIIQDCKLELNTGEIVNKSIYDSSGNSNKGLLFGDYKIKKKAKNSPISRDTSIKIPKINNNKDGAL